MKRFPFRMIGQVGLVLFLMTTLAMGASSYNATHQPPRSVFLTLPDDVSVPEVTLSTWQAHDGAWVITIDTTGFQFTELCLPHADATPIGHAHVMINGVKTGSAFSPFFDLGALAPGTYQVSVVLRAQDHRALLAADGLIADDITITVPNEL